MAMRSSFVYGYGFEFDCDIRKFADFLSTHKEAFCVADKEKEVFSSFENLLKKEDFESIQELFDTYSERESVGPVVAFIMSQETVLITVQSMLIVIPLKQYFLQKHILGFLMTEKNWLRKKNFVVSAENI